MKSLTDNDSKVALRIALLTIHDTRKPETDTSAHYLAGAIEASGHVIADRAICPDNRYAIRKYLSDWILRDDVHIIVTNGGTGMRDKNSTLAAVTPLFDTDIAGFGELFRAYSFADIGSSGLQSNAVGGKANNTLIFCLPGSTGACRLGWEKILREQLDSHHQPCNFASAYAKRD
ncbi:molybdopterin biosynthesis protein B [Advenella kashmirensis W13003]|uniref:Molybdenum cofactor biosynthesis protein B n=1 Tax=Advenella kashmirensis W13003 TaxID=1424334 RepID=V8QP86_9BURK|nr:molybdenum cofactor synthesis domain-containing protein [Advenella kashmirensis]ETF01138.1 molybdopterin biosynthesis protein B [Advenella kashmirensis W13003]